MNTTNNLKRVSQRQDQILLGQSQLEMAAVKRNSDVPKDLNMIADCKGIRKKSVPIIQAININPSSHNDDHSQP